MASVFEAYEARLDRCVALKVLPGDFLHEPAFAERFDREAKLVARLEHPHIIPIYAYGIDDGVPWMAMRLVAGGPVSALLGSGALEPRRAVGILSGVAAALDHAHSRGVLHRDVKPANVLLDDDHVYLADFGIARMVEGSPVLTRTGMIAGTPQYMAPEQAQGAPTLDHRGDIYALGVVAYEMLTGRVPFNADTPVAVLMKHVLEPVPLPVTLPEPLARALLTCLAKSPGDRWSSAGEFVRALTAGLGDAAGPRPVTEPTIRGHAAPAPARPSAAPTLPTQRLPGQPTQTRAAPPGSADASGRSIPRRRRLSVLLAATLAVAGAGALLLLALRGRSTPAPGVRLVLQVMTGEAVDAAVDQAKLTARELLAERGIAFTFRSAPVGAGSFALEGLEPPRAREAREILLGSLPGWEVPGGGAPSPNAPGLVLALTAERRRAVEEATVGQVMETLRRRAAAVDADAPVIARRERAADQIVVQLPGVTDADTAKRALTTRAWLTFNLVENEADGRESLLRGHQGKLPEDMEVYPARGERAGESHYYLVRRQAAIVGGDLRSAWPSTDELDQPTVRFTLTPQAADLFGRVTGRNVGRKLAIILDGSVVSAPIIQGRIAGGEGQIQGGFSAEEAGLLSKLLQAGALAVTVKVLEESAIGAETAGASPDPTAVGSPEGPRRRTP
jgi:protein-export membrane protein SecD